MEGTTYFINGFTAMIHVKHFFILVGGFHK